MHRPTTDRKVRQRLDAIQARQRRDSPADGIVAMADDARTRELRDRIRRDADRIASPGLLAQARRATYYR